MSRRCKTCGRFAPAQGCARHAVRQLTVERVPFAGYALVDSRGQVVAAAKTKREARVALWWQ